MTAVARDKRVANWPSSQENSGGFHHEVEALAGGGVLEKLRATRAVDRSFANWSWNDVSR